MKPFEQQHIMVTGGAGFLGSYVVEKLQARGCHNVMIPRSKDFDLTCETEVQRLFEQHPVDTVIHLAARVGGIGANQAAPGSFFYQNLMMGALVMEQARRHGVQKFVGVGTVCAYPKHCPTPFREEDLWSGYPEETNAPYALAKKMLLVQGQAYRQQYGLNAIHLLPVNLYGPRDNFDPASSHVIPALIRKFVTAVQSQAAVVDVWGSGAATREFLYVGDAAEAIALATEHYDGSEPVNIGSGTEIAIRDLVMLLADITGFTGKIHWQTDKPDGQPHRRLDTTRAEKEFGFKAHTTFNEGLKDTIDWYLTQANPSAKPASLGQA